MIKINRKPKEELYLVSTFFTLFDLPEMKIFVTSNTPKAHYINIKMGLNDEWWKVSEKDLSDENETDTYIRAMRYFGVFLRRKTSEEHLKELGLLI